MTFKCMSYCKKIICPNIWKGWQVRHGLKKSGNYVMMSKGASLPQ